MTTENLPPRTIARLVREVRDLVVRQQQQQQQQQNQNTDNDGEATSTTSTEQQQQPPLVEGVRLIVDLETGLPSNLGELMVRDDFLVDKRLFVVDIFLSSWCFHMLEKALIAVPLLCTTPTRER